MGEGVLSGHDAGSGVGSGVVSDGVVLWVVAARVLSLYFGLLSVFLVGAIVRIARHAEYTLRLLGVLLLDVLPYGAHPPPPARSSVPQAQPRCGSSDRTPPAVAAAASSLPSAAPKGETAGEGVS